MIAIDGQYAGFNAWRTSGGWRLTLGYIAITYAVKSEDVFIRAMNLIVDEIKMDLGGNGNE